MARHKRSKQINRVDQFAEDAETINKIYARYMFELQTTSPQYAALLDAQEELWKAVRSVTGEEKLPWDRPHFI